MPRLPFWGLSAAATAGTWYVGYHFVYEPRHVAQIAVERNLTQSKQQHQDVIHAYARLRTKVEEQCRNNSNSNSNSGRGATRDIAAVGAWFTNADKITFFCDVQLLRHLLHALPRHLTTEHDLHHMLGELVTWETQHCTELHFRDAPLLLAQTLRCVACYALYVLMFRVTAPLLSAWDGFANTRAQLLHRSARFITNTLEIDVVMSTSTATAKVNADEQGQEPERRTEETRGKSEETNAVGGKSLSPSASARVEYIVFNPTHWIEEVGFWACPSNPLLTPHKQTSETQKKQRLAAETTATDSGALPQLICSSAPFNAFRKAATLTYAQYWHREAEKAASRGEDAPTAPSTTAALADVAAAEVSFGYPVIANRVSSLPETDNQGQEEGTAVRYIPVGVSGLPHLLYVDAAHAVADVRPLRTREEVYAQRQQAQYSHAPLADRVKAAEVEGVTHATTSANSQPETELQQWRSRGIIPWWRRVWWGGVYGGPSRLASAPSSSYTLRYYLGEPCTAANYVTKSIEASRAAEALSR